MKALKTRMKLAEKKAEQKAKFDSMPPWTGGFDDMQLPSIEELENFFDNAQIYNNTAMAKNAKDYQ